MGLEQRLSYVNPMETMTPDANNLARFNTQPPLGCKYLRTQAEGGVADGSSIANGTNLISLGLNAVNGVRIDPYSMIFTSATNNTVTFRVPGWYFVNFRVYAETGGAGGVGCMVGWVRNGVWSPDADLDDRNLVPGNPILPIHLKASTFFYADPSFIGAGGTLSLWALASNNAAVTVNWYVLDMTVWLVSAVNPGKY